jgi:hypothetical protein
LALETFFSSSELGEMGICLETSDDMVPMQKYELVGLLPTSNNCEDSDGCIWEISEGPQICQ